MVKSKQSVIGRNWRNQIRQIGRWVIPVAIWDLLRAREVKVKGAQKDVNKEFVPDILSKNDILRNRHKGKRCFIIGTGPSIQGQDLSPLCSEICFVLNFFYLHPEYKKISPDYYVFSGLANHPHISLTDGLKQYQEMEVKTGNSTLILHNADRAFIQGHKLFEDKQVYYFKDGRDWDDLELTGIDLTKAIYNGQSVSITAIQVALYMGFSQIYLLGLDHNWICTQLHEQHFYAKQDSIIDRKYDVALRQTTNLRTTFEAHARLWAQYERLKAFAQSNNALICNATNGGLLDVFDRVKYESLV